MTDEGYRALDDQLKHLKTVERPAVIAAIAEAREHGDLSENAEYHAAKERQGWIEGSIAEIEDKLSRAQVIDVSKLSGDQVKFGATVTVVDEDTEDEGRYQIVGEHEADVKQGKISISSPIARASYQISNAMAHRIRMGPVMMLTTRPAPPRNTRHYSS